MRGEFVRSDGLVIPNNITTFGQRTILAAALCNIDTTFFVGLATAAPSLSLTLTDVAEPTHRVNGYERIEVARSAVGWPTEGTLNNHPYFESQWLEWEAEGGDFDTEVNRLILMKLSQDDDSLSDDNLKVLAISAAMPAPLIITPDTPLNLRRYKYRIYGG